MSFLVENQLAPFVVTQPLYPNQTHSGQNDINDKSCHWLAQAAWPRLNDLMLSIFGEIMIDLNKITFKGCEYIAKGNWPYMQEIWICKVFN